MFLSMPSSRWSVVPSDTRLCIWDLRPFSVPIMSAPRQILRRALQAHLQILLGLSPLLRPPIPSFRRVGHTFLNCFSHFCLALLMFKSDICASHVVRVRYGHLTLHTESCRIVLLYRVPWSVLDPWWILGIISALTYLRPTLSTCSSNSLPKLPFSETGSCFVAQFGLELVILCLRVLGFRDSWRWPLHTTFSARCAPSYSSHCLPFWLVRPSSPGRQGPGFMF